MLSSKHQAVSIKPICRSWRIGKRSGTCNSTQLSVVSSPSVTTQAQPSSMATHCMVTHLTRPRSKIPRSYTPIKHHEMEHAYSTHCCESQQDTSHTDHVLQNPQWSGQCQMHCPKTWKNSCKTDALPKLWQNPRQQLPNKKLLSRDCPRLVWPPLFGGWGAKCRKPSQLGWQHI